MKSICSIDYARPTLCTRLVVVVMVVVIDEKCVYESKKALSAGVAVPCRETEFIAQTPALTL